MVLKPQSDETWRAEIHNTFACGLDSQLPLTYSQPAQLSYGQARSSEVLSLLARNVLRLLAMFSCHVDGG